MVPLDPPHACPGSHSLHSFLSSGMYLPGMSHVLQTRKPAMALCSTLWLKGSRCGVNVPSVHAVQAV